jgi:hypothetical protein
MQETVKTPQIDIVLAQFYPQIGAEPRQFRLGYDSSNAGSGMYIGILGGYARMDVGDGFTAWMTSLEFTGGQVTSLSGGLYFGGAPYSKLSVSIPWGSSIVQSGINGSPAAINYLNNLSGMFCLP